MTRFGSKATLIGTALLALSVADPMGRDARAADVQPILNNLATMKGSERLKVLEEEANREGKVVVYAADDPNVMRAWADAFKAKYPKIEVQYVRMNTRDMIQRVTAESAANRPVASLLGGVTATELAILKNQGLVARYLSPEAADFDPAFRDPEGHWTAHWYAPELIGFNTDLIKKDSVPATLEALADFQAGRKLGRLDVGGRWIAGIVKAKGQEDGMALVKRIAARKPQLFNSTSALTNALTSGQIALAFDMHAGNIGIAKSRGAPIDYVVPEPLFLLPAYTVFLKDAPHPHAAALNYDWRLAKDGGQSFYKEFFQNGPRKDTDYPFMNEIKAAKTIVALSSDVLANVGQDDKTFRELFVGK